MTQEQAMGIARHILTMAGGYLVSQGLTDQPTMVAIVGGLSAALGVAWSYFSKPKAK
jgi:hypothetical protein